jgi:uncharacterized membrane protein YkoI
MSVTIASATSANTAKPEAPKTAIAEKSDATEAKNTKETEKVKDPAKESAENAQLVAKAKITELAAIATVQATNPDATIVSGGLGNENGKVVYQLNVTAKDGTKSEVKVDAITGTITPEADGNVQYED